jgi:hypothetical protein
MGKRLAVLVGSSAYLEIDRCAPGRSVRTVQHRIADVAAQREVIADSVGHVRLWRSDYDSPASPAYIGFDKSPAAADLVDNSCGVIWSVTILPSPPFTYPLDDKPHRPPLAEEPSNPWSSRVGVPVGTTTLRPTFITPGGIHSRGVYGAVRALTDLTFRPAAPPPDNKPTLLRLLDGILAALRLMVILVLAALSRHPQALTFVLVMLAACLHYGRRAEPAERAFLPMRQFQRSLGSCPQV